MVDDYNSNIKNYSVEKQKSIMASIQSKCDAVKNVCKDKVQISIQNYALVCSYWFVNLLNPRIVLIHMHMFQVDNRIRNLDNAIPKFEKQVRLKADI